MTFDEWLDTQGKRFDGIEPSWALRVAYNVGFLSRKEEVLRLEGLLRRALVHCDISPIEGSRGLFDEIITALGEE